VQLFINCCVGARQQLQQQQVTALMGRAAKKTLPSQDK
jgi:hypothetical protein